MKELNRALVFIKDLLMTYSNRRALAFTEVLPL